MKFLYITGYADPYDFTNGFNIRSNYIANALCEIGEVELLTFKYNIKESKNKKFSKIYKVSLGEFPFWNLPEKISNNIFLSKVYRLFEILFKKNPFFQINKRAASYVESVINKSNYDIVVILRFETAATLALLNKKNIIIDIDDHPIDGITGRYLNKFYPLKKIAEKKISNYYNYWKKNIPVLWFSNINQVKEQNAFFLPNLCPPFNEGTTPKNTNLNTAILFVGSLSYGPNISGLKLFINKVWTKLIQEKPDYRFYIVGGGLPNKLIKKWSSIPGIRLLGFIDDLNQVYSKSSIFVSPIFEGAGTNIKILEAIKRKIPIITSRFSVRGYEDFLLNNKDVIIIDDIPDFKEKIIMLSEDKSKQRELVLTAYNSLSNSKFNYSFFKSSIKNSISFIKNVNKINISESKFSINC